MEENNTPSLRDSLASSWDSLAGTEPAPTPEVSPGDGQEAPVVEQTVEAAEPAQQESEPEKVFAAPEHWPQTHKDYFGQLDDAGKQLWLDKVSDLEKGHLKQAEELAEQRKRYSGFDGFTESLQSQYPTMSREQIASAVVNALPQLVNTYSSLQKDPVGTLRKLADTYNVADKLSESLLGQDNDNSARQARLRETELEQENIRLRQEQQKAARDSADREIAKFRDETGPDGKPLRPYFSELEPHMARLIQSDSSISLQRAYDMALRTEKFEDLMKAERDKAKAEAEAERRKKANARTVTKPTIGKSNGSGTPQPKPKSLRETLSDGWDDLATRQ